MSNELRKAGGLWLRTGKQDGQQYLAGKVEAGIPAGAKLMIFANKFKTLGSNELDYRIMLDASETQPPMQRAEPGQQSPSTAGSEPDDVPF